MHTSKTVEVLAIAYIGWRGSMWGGDDFFLDGLAGIYRWAVDKVQARRP